MFEKKVLARLWMENVTKLSLKFVFFTWDLSGNK
jgi:hypothetical protein